MNIRNITLFFVILFFNIYTFADSSHSINNQTIEVIKKDIINKHPSSYIILASKLFKDKKMDEAVKWYYIGQIRYRAHLMANPKLDPSGDPALYTSLKYVIGSSINQYAGKDPDHWLELIEESIKWHTENPNGYTPKNTNKEIYTTIKEQFTKFRDHVSNINKKGDPQVGNPDKLLLNSLVNNQLEHFKNLLQKGANPNKIYGSEPEDWVMCKANELGNTKFLKLAIEYGGDVNLRNGKGLYSAPIFCSGTMTNYEAFRVLFDNNVKIDIKKWPNATKIKENNPHLKPELWGKTFYGSPIINTARNNQYHAVYDILQRKKKLTWEEQYSLKNNIISGIIDPKSIGYQWKIKVAELLRQRGYNIDMSKVLRE
jgi:hypothetical protein